MSTDISTAMVNTYNAGLEMLAQQMDSKLATRVRIEAETGERVSFDQIGAVAARKDLVRHQDTQYVNTPSKRRWVSMNDWSVADLLDKKDVLKILNNPGSEYSRTMIAAIQRERDADIITAALGAAYTGKDGTTAVALPAAQQIAAGGTGFTLAKVASAMTKLKAGNGVEGNPELTIAWTSYQEAEFMGAAEVKSVDYNTQRVLVKGGMGDDTFYGFNYVRLEDWTDELGAPHKILPKVATTRSCVAWIRSGILHNVPKAPSARIDELANKKYAWQYFVSGSFGSTRMQEGFVVQIDVVEP